MDKHFEMPDVIKFLYKSLLKYKCKIIYFEKLDKDNIYEIRIKGKCYGGEADRIETIYLTFAGNYIGSHILNSWSQDIKFFPRGLR